MWDYPRPCARPAAGFPPARPATVHPVRVRPFARDQLLMPPQNRVGRDEGGDLTPPATAQPVPAHGQPTPLVIAQPQAPSPQLPPQDAILFDQIRHGLLLLTI